MENNYHNFKAAFYALNPFKVKFKILETIFERGGKQYENYNTQQETYLHFPLNN